MPKVKKKSRRKSSRRTKSSNGFLTSLKGAFSRYAVAGVAGLTVVLAVGGLLLWSGGYVGLAGEQAGRIAKDAAVSAGLDIRRVTAVGYDKTTEDDLMLAIGPVVGASIAHFDIYAARARVEGLGWVRSAAVTRLWPNTIHVSIHEREPAAVWQLSGALHLIDQTGAVIREIDAFEYSNLPLIVGAGAPDAVSDVLRALRSESALWGEAAALVRVGDRRWNLRLKSGADIKFPEQDVEAAVRTLARLQTAYGLLDRPLEYVDLRDPSRLVYRERTDETRQAQEQEIQ
jgi:cell division protein FtsQ